MPSSIGDASDDRVDAGSNVADYFLEIGLPDDLSPDKETVSSRRPPVQYPITEISLIFPSQGESVPEGWEWLRFSPNGHLADLNTNALRGQSVYLIYKRAKTFSLHERPLTDLGVLYEGRENLRPDCEQLYQSFYGRPGFVNTKSAVGGQRTYVTFRRRQPIDPLPIQAITDIAVLFPKKGDVIPHSFRVVSKNINKGSVTAAEVYLCYKQSIIQPPSLIFEPTLISRYPLINHDAKHFSLTLIEKDCANIAMPNGASVQYWSFNAAHRTVALPQFSTFVLTNHLGVTMYGSALTFYEEFPASRLSTEQKGALKALCSETDNESEDLDPRVLQSEKCICLLSQKPLFPVFKEFLYFLFSFCSSPGDRGPIPVEKLISYFMYDVSCPSPEKPLIIVDLGARKLNLSWPSPCSSLPQKGSSFITFLKNVGVDIAIDLFSLVLLESTIVFHSLRPSVLTTVMETLVAAIFPLKWTGTYIPSCARQMVTSAECPGCAMIGIDSRTYDALDDYDLISPEGSKQICFVDLDTTQIKMSEDKKTFRAEKLLPKKGYKCLKKTLSDCHREIDSKPEIYGERGGELAEITEKEFTRRKIYSMELKCQEAFLKFMAIVMKGYQNFLRDSTSNNSSAKQTAFQNFDDLFDMNEFIRSQKSSKQFYQEFCNTHSFAHFIHLRSHSSNQDNTNTIAHLDYNVFFDECIEKMANEQEDSKLLEVDKSLLVEHCQFIPPPEPSDPSLSYDYSGIFPKLDMKLFGSSNFCNSGSASANASVLSTPVHGRDFNKNGNNHTPTGKTPLWRTPAENKGAQRNAKILYDMTLKNRSNIVTSSGNNYPEGDLEGGVSVTKQWVKHLKMNCFTMWFMLLPANLSLKIEEKNITEELTLAEETLNEVLEKFAKPTNKQKPDDLNSSILNSVAVVGNTPKQPNVLPDEVIYRVLIFCFHKYTMIKNIYLLQQTLKKHGVKLNAATYTYLNSMLLNAATNASLSNKQGPTKGRSRVRVHWVMVRCSVKFILLWRKKHVIPKNEKPLEIDNLSCAKMTQGTTVEVTGCADTREDGPLVPCGDRPSELELPEPTSELIEMSPFSKTPTAAESCSNPRGGIEEGAKAMDLLEHKTPSTSQIKRNRSLHGIPQTHSVNRKLFSNSQTSLNTSEHEHPINTGASFSKHKQRFNSLDDHLEAKLNTCEHSASNESCRIQNPSRETDQLTKEPLTSSTVDGLHKLVEVNMEKTMESMDDTDNGVEKKSTEELLNVTQDTTNSSHDNLGEKDHDCKGFDDQSGLKSEARDDATEQHIEPRALNLTRADSTASSLDEGHSKTEQHKLAAMILGKVFKASDSFHNLAKQSFAGSTSTISEDRISCSSNLASQATNAGVGTEKDKKLSNESLLTSAANYTQKVLQNSTVRSIRDQVQQVAHEMKYAVTSDTPLEPDLASIKSSNTPKKNNTNVNTIKRSVPPVQEKASQRPAISSSKYEGRFRKKCVSSLVSVQITSVYTCNSSTCRKTLYDEEIMAQWNHDDSSFSITCPCKTSQTGSGQYQTCGRTQLPKLTVVIKDYRQQYYECGCEQCLEALRKFSPDWLREVDSIVQAQKSKVSTSNFSPVLGGSQPAVGDTKNNSAPPNTTSCNSLNEIGEVSAGVKTNQRGLGEILEVSGAGGSFQNDEKEPDSGTQNTQNSEVSSNREEEQNDSCLVNSTATPLLRTRRSYHRRYPSAPPIPLAGGAETWSLPGGIPCRLASGSSTSQLSLQNASSSNLDEHSMASRGQPVLETIGDNASTSSSSHTTPGLRNMDKKLSPPHEIGPILINYLSPLVVRKALERMIDNSGGSDEILSSGEMVDEKMDIYWNLVWYFSRLKLKTHLCNLLLKSRLLNSGHPLTSAVSLERQVSASSSAIAVECEDSVSVSSMLSNTVKLASMTGQTKNPHVYPLHPTAGTDLCLALPSKRKCLRREEKQGNSTSGAKDQSTPGLVDCGVHVTTLWDKLIRSPEQRSKERSSTFCENESDVGGDVSWEMEAPLYLSWLKSEEPRLDKLDISVTWLPDRWKPEFAKKTFDAIFRDRDMDSVMQEIIMYLTRPKASVDLAANPNRRAIHREMLFTAIAALGSNRINIDAFFSSYNEAYLKLNDQAYYQSKMSRQDLPPSQLAVDFASSFGGLQI